MKKILVLLFLAFTLAACGQAERDDSWSSISKFRRGELVIYRLDGSTGMVARSDCSDHLQCVYHVQHPAWHGLRPTKAFEIDKAPSRACTAGDNTVIVYQAGDKAAEARCK